MAIVRLRARAKAVTPFAILSENIQGLCRSTRLGGLAALSTDVLRAPPVDHQAAAGRVASAYTETATPPKRRRRRSLNRLTTNRCRARLLCHRLRSRARLRTHAQPAAPADLEGRGSKGEIGKLFGLHDLLEPIIEAFAIERPACRRRAIVDRAS